MNDAPQEQTVRGRVSAGAWLTVSATYLTALIAAAAMVAPLMHMHPIPVAVIGAFTATLAVFLLSFTFDNTGLFDPYWSLAPIALALFWGLGCAAPQVETTRQILATSGVGLWGLRLTWNWARSWHGLGHEDWRYAEWRDRAGSWFWPLSFVAFQLVPSIQVMLGSLVLYPALATSAAPLGPLDLLAAVVTGSAIAIESVADRQLRRFAQNGREPDEILATGLWAWCRHPNYLGEVMFWWGLYLFGLAADPAWWWTGLGPLSITAMFVFASVPMMEARMVERRPRYVEIQKTIPALIPRPPHGTTRP
jgi:steroid 5-alpha reductase family enzyme